MTAWVCSEAKSVAKQSAGTESDIHRTNARQEYKVQGGLCRAPLLQVHRCSC